MNILGTTNLNFSKAATTLLLLLLLVGCVKDRAAAPVPDLVYDPPQVRQMNGESPVSNESPAATIQQTSFESQIASREQHWHDSLPAAVAEAQSAGKLILADFTGSDWCPPCKALKKTIFDTPEFKSWAAENVVLLELDFPKRSQLDPEIKKQNEMLQNRYNITSYPTVLLIDVHGNVKAKFGYQRGQSPSQWVQVANAHLSAGPSGSGTIRR